MTHTAAEVKYRGLKRKDYPRLLEIIDEAWGLYSYSNKKLIKMLILRHYLYSYLAIQSFTRIATYNNIPVGFIMGRCNKAYKKLTSLKYGICSTVISSFLNRSSSGRLYLHLRQLIEEADSQMMQGYSFDGEGVLFAVDKDFRGKGIGKYLLESFKQYEAENSAKHIYFFTDSFSDVEYYRSHGYQQIEKTTVDFFTKKGFRSEFYLFGFTV